MLIFHSSLTFIFRKLDFILKKMTLQSDWHSGLVAQLFLRIRCLAGADIGYCYKKSCRVLSSQKYFDLSTFSFIISWSFLVFLKIFFSLFLSISTRVVSTVRCKETRLFGIFLYKMLIFTSLKITFKVGKNLPFLSQFFISI